MANEAQAWFDRASEMLGRIEQRLDNLETYVDRRSSGIEASIGEQFDESRQFIDERFGKIVTWMLAMDSWTDSVDKRFEALERSIRRLESSPLAR